MCEMCWQIFYIPLVLLFTSMTLSHSARARQAEMELNNMLDAVLLQRQRLTDRNSPINTLLWVLCSRGCC